MNAFEAAYEILRECFLIVGEVCVLFWATVIKREHID
jgi:hypothetical protein